MAYHSRNAVLIIIFNRPHATHRVFHEVRRARPPRLYVAADGPRRNRCGEAERCNESRRIATEVDWPCDIRTLFHPKNLGSAVAIPQAVNWFFGHEEKGVVLEDDCLPCPGFFQFCDQLLERFKEEPRVWWINGSNLALNGSFAANYYAFSSYAASWGWASWRRAWTHFDPSTPALTAAELSTVLHSRFSHSPLVRFYWRFIWDYAYRIKNWDYRWLFTCWRHDALACVPGVNLICNIGSGGDAVHTRNPKDKRLHIPCGELQMPIEGPADLVRSHAVDRHFEQSLYQISLLNVFRVLVLSRAPWLRTLKRRFHQGTC